MKLIINIEKHRAGIYGDEIVFNCITDLFYAIEGFFPHHTIPGRYIKKEIAKAKRIELLAKALVENLKAMRGV